MEKKYEIIIKENETGKEVFHEHSDGFICSAAVVHDGKAATACMCATACTIMDIINFVD